MEITNDTTNNEISTDQVTIATFTCNIIPDKVSYLNSALEIIKVSGTFIAFIIIPV